MAATSPSREQALRNLNQAVLSISGELDLPKTLQQIVNAARALAGARYAALGVFDSDGHLAQFVHSGLTPEAADSVTRPPQGQGLLGALLDEPRSIRLARIADDPRSGGFPPGHPHMVSFLGVPILAGEVVLGNLYLTEKESVDEFSPEDQEVIELLATHAAIAITNARLLARVSELAIHEERSRIAMDLHDGVIQSIYAVGLRLESAVEMLDTDPVDAHGLLVQSMEGLNETVRDIRNFIMDLRPSRFEGDLETGMARLVREFQANTLIPVQAEIPPATMAALPAAVARAVFLTAQEALANIARHAHATRVHVELNGSGAQIRLVISDDGAGFDPTAQPMALGHGLSNMRDRAEALGGRCEVEAGPGRGTTVTLLVPV